MSAGKKPSARPPSPKAIASCQSPVELTERERSLLREYRRMNVGDQDFVDRTTSNLADKRQQRRAQPRLRLITGGAS
jgi:hypothetical protein